MAESPEVKVRLTAEDQGLTAAIGQLRNELGKLQSEQLKTAATSQKVSGAFKNISEQALTAVKLRLANLPGLGNFGSLLAVRAYEPIGKMLEESAAGIEEKFGGAALVIGGAAAALAAFGAIAFGVTHHMMDLAQSIENAAAATGLSRAQLQEYAELAKEMDVDAQSLQMAFSRVQMQLGEFITTGKAAGAGSQNFIRVMKELGISITDSAGKLRPVNDILGDFSDALAKIPDQETRAALEAAALGTRGRVLAQVMEEAAREGVSLRDALASIDKSGNVIPDSQLDNLMKAKHRWDELMRSIRGAKTELEGFIAESLTSVRGFERGIATGLAALSPLPGKQAQALVDRLLPEPTSPSASGGSGAADVLAIGQISEQNEKLAQRLSILRAGGEAQLQLKNAEAGYAAAVKAHNTELAKQYAEEISQLRSIIALEAAKKVHEKAPEIVDAAAKAQLTLSLKQQQDLLTIWKAGAAGRAEVDKEGYEKGTISLKAYFDRRRAEMQQETAKEIAVLKQERDQVQRAAELAGQQAAAKKTAAGAAKTPQTKQELLNQADRLAAEQLNQLARVDEMNARIATMEIESRTKITALDAEEFKADESNKQKIIGFLKEIDELQHKTVESSKEEIAAKTAAMRVVLEQAGYASRQIDELLARYTQLKTSAAQFAAQEKSTQEGILALENQRRAIEIQLRDSVISKEQAEKRAKELLNQEIPVLMKQAQLELQIAQASGDQQRIAQAQQSIQKIQNMGTQINRMGQIGKQVSAGLTQNFSQFFESIPRGTRAMVEAFGQMELSVIRSLENVAAQMLANLLVGDGLTEGTKLNDAKTAAANVYANVSAIPVIGWILAPAAAAAAFTAVLAFKKGGIVPGSGRGDTVPAMLAPQEMILPAGISAGLTRAINTGSIARPSDFRTPSVNLPAIAPAASGSRAGSFSPTYNLYHNGPDAKEVLQKELVPLLESAQRSGRWRPEY